MTTLPSFSTRTGLHVRTTPVDIIAIHGACYVDNFGDILLLQLLTRAIRKQFPSSLLSMPFATPEAATKIGVDLVGVKNIFICKAFVYSGGGYFGEPNNGKLRWAIRNCFRYFLPGLVAIALRKPILIVGVGAGPIRYKVLRLVISFLFSKAEFVSVRDQESLSFLKEIGVDVTKVLQTADLALALADPAFRAAYLPELDDASADLSRSEGRIGIHFNTIKAGTYEAELSKGLISRFGANQMIALNDQGKDKLDGFSDGRSSPSEQILQNVPMVKYSYPSQFIREIGVLAVVVTKKLHVGIIASLLGVPVVAIPTHSKTLRFYRQIGKSKYSVSANEGKVNEISALVESARNEEWRIPPDILSLSLDNLKFLRKLGEILDYKKALPLQVAKDHPVGPQELGTERS